MVIIMSDQKTVLENYRRRINRNLAVFLDREMRDNRRKNAFFRRFLNELKKYHLRKSSKRIRAILILLGYRLFRNKIPNQITDLSYISELIHNSFLIQDDIIDRDLSRRGAPTFHYLFENWHKKKFKIGEAKHFGLSLGILGADIGFSQAYKRIIESKLPDVTKLRILARFNQMYFDTVYGEITDVISGYKKRITEKEVREIYLYKTAKYTMEGPLHLGALAAGASRQALNPLSSYAIPLGIAFQIQDDILGIFGDEKTIGKAVTSDLEEGKKTLIMVEAFRKADSRQRKILRKYFGNKHVTLKGLNEVRKIIVETGALKYSQDNAMILVERAKRALLPLKKADKSALILLNYLADYIINRNH